MPLQTIQNNLRNLMFINILSGILIGAMMFQFFISYNAKQECYSKGYTGIIFYSGSFYCTAVINGNSALISTE